ncbi:MAG: PQQ-binding-like beta-propeller repeat protein [Bacteroidota bacterium]|nr:PQQ-binding-like beta-propeller repeat protein [Bacteroidota bacterium]
MRLCRGLFATGLLSAILAVLPGCDTATPNAAPSAPRVIRGTDSAAVDARVEILVVANDPAGMALTYEVDWGDGRTLDVHANIESGLWYTLSHHFFTAGIYHMRCRATNAAGRISPWSAPFRIVIAGEAIVGRGDWWMYMRDAQHSGHSPFAGPSVPVLSWKIQTASPIRSSASYDAAGNLYFGSDDFNLRAVYPDGQLRWQYSTGLARIRNTPAVHSDGSTAFGSSSANVYLLDGWGEKRWNSSVASPILRSNAVRDSEGRIYIGGQDHALSCFARDGSQHWRFVTGGAMEGSPALARDEQTVYIGGRDQLLYAVTRDGRQAWTYAAAAPISGSPSVGPTNHIYFGDEAGWLYALRPDGSLAWRRLLHAPIRTTPAVTREGVLHSITSEGKLFALDGEGRIIWDLLVAQAGGEGSPAVDVHGTIYLGTPDGALVAISSAGQFRWRFDVTDAVHTTPAIGPDGSIAFGCDDGWLYMLRER